MPLCKWYALVSSGRRQYAFISLGRPSVVWLSFCPSHCLSQESPNWKAMENAFCWKVEGEFGMETKARKTNNQWRVLNDINLGVRTAKLKSWLFSEHVFFFPLASGCILFAFPTKYTTSVTFPKLTCDNSINRINTKKQLTEIFQTNDQILTADLII